MSAGCLKSAEMWLENGLSNAMSLQALPQMQLLRFGVLRTTTCPTATGSSPMPWPRTVALSHVRSHRGPKWHEATLLSAQTWGFLPQSFLACDLPTFHTFPISFMDSHKPNQVKPKQVKPSQAKPCQPLFQSEKTSRPHVTLMICISIAVIT